jgi:hypothetical protein
VSCNDFQAKFDLYFDGELGADEMRHAAEHVGCCPACEALVTGNQRLHAFLVTAVTDRVAAVDVSGLWDGIEARLAEEASPLVRKPSAAASISDRIVDLLGVVFGDGGFSPARAGAFAAAAAAAVVFLVSLAVTDAPQPTADTATRLATALPTPRVRPVSIDAMEIGEGHTVSTWMRPKTRTRVFWVGAAADDPSDGFSVDPASLDR